jgi:hypothetical protein
VLLPAGSRAGKYDQAANPHQVSHLGKCLAPVPVMLKALARYGHIKVTISVRQLVPSAHNVNTLALAQVAAYILSSVPKEITHAAVDVE